MFFKRKQHSYPRYSLPSRHRVQNTRGIGKTLSPFPESAPTRQIRPRGFFAKRKRAAILIAILAILIYTAYSLFFSGKLKITSIEVFEDKEPQTDHLITRLLKKLEGDNLLLLKTEKLEAYLKSQYPYYATLKVTKNFPSILVISMETYPIVANITIEITNNEKQEWQINSAGQLTTTEKGNPELPNILIKLDQAPEQGQTVMEQTALAFLLDARQTFEDKFGMKILYNEYLQNAREAHLLTERNFEVWLDTLGDMDTQLNKLKQSLSRLNIYEENLSYIDLRISGIQGEKVIFKKR